MRSGLAEETNPGTIADGEAAGPVVARARRYPFGAPAHSYVYCHGATLELADPTAPLTPGSEVTGADDAARTTLAAACSDLGVDAAAELRAERTPVLAYGSNAAPETLERKYDSGPDAGLIPAIRARLDDFDVVYSAHFKRGAVPGTLQRSPGTSVRVFVLFLSDSQLEHLHSTESLGANYALARLERIELELENGERLTSVFTYLSLSGPLTLGGREVALDGIDVSGRRFPTMSQVDLQTELQRWLSPHSGLETFMERNVRSRDAAVERAGRLRERARPLDWEHWRFVETVR